MIIDTCSVQEEASGGLTPSAAAVILGYHVTVVKIVCISLQEAVGD